VTRMRRGTFCILLILISLNLVWARDAKYDPATKRIRVLYLGDAWRSSSPIFQIYKDPMFMATPVPASATHGYIEDMNKILRAYMPRTYSDYVSKYDITILSDTQAVFYTQKQLKWFKDGVENGGQGLLMVGGRDIQLGAWPGTSVEDALPATFVGIQTYEQAFKAIPVNPNSEFIQALPFKTLPEYLGMNVVTPRQDSTVILTSTTGGHFPVLVYHDFGKGGSMFHTPDWTPLWGGYLSRWEYYGDFVVNLLYKVGGLSIPQNPALMHAIREYFGDYEVKKGLIMSLAEFIDMMGANTGALDRKMTKVYERKNEASSLYLEQDYEGVVNTMKDLLQEMDDVERLALRLKDRAMTWIYITEVTALTGTSLAAGTVIWLLMVRRKLYREVGVTRPKQL